MNRRDALVLFGAAVVLPVGARAEQTAIPVVAMLNGQSAENYSYLADAVADGLKNQGFEHGKNVLIEHRWAAGHDEQLPAMAVELVNRGVAAMVTGGSLWATISAKAATARIPIVFTTASDPIKLGFVTALNRPGGNVTGVTFLASQLVVKRLELAAQLVGKKAIIGFLGRPREPRYAADRKNIEAAAGANGQKVLFLDVGGEP
jgi:putative ABC transport system substrate-binding protein